MVSLASLRAYIRFKSLFQSQKRSISTLQNVKNIAMISGVHIVYRGTKDAGIHTCRYNKAPTMSCIQLRVKHQNGVIKDIHPNLKTGGYVNMYGIMSTVLLYYEYSIIVSSISQSH